MKKKTMTAGNAGSNRLKRVRLKRVLGRGAVAVMTAVVLALSGVLPEGNSLGTGLLPATVEAADGPSKGTITFYRYTKIEHAEDLPKYNFDVMLIYKRGDNWFFPKEVTDINNSSKNWKTYNVNCDPKINPDAKEFMSRTKWSGLKMRYSVMNAKGTNVEGYRIRDSALNQVSHTTEYLEWHKNGDGGTHFTPQEDGTTGTFWGRFVTGNNNVVWLRKAAAVGSTPERLDWHGWGGDWVAFEIYRIEAVTYNCINANYSIGKEDGSDPQVYQANGANGGLFLKEGVTLTVPKNSILVVKNGPFYVNGKINCYGTILVEDGGILTTYDSTGAGGNINLYEGSAMIVRSGGRAYAGCPQGSLGAAWDGSLNVYPGASIINYGLLVAGNCDFMWSRGSAIVENHKGAAMYLGYAVEDEKKFLNMAYAGASADALGLVKTNGKLLLQSGSAKTVFKVWDGATTGFANNRYSLSVKLYSYDKDGKCTVKEYKP